MFTRTALLVAAAAGFVAAQNGTAIATTTRVVDEYVTYCPEPTTFEFNNHKYIVTAPTTLTITDCPCTVVETGTVVKPYPPAGSEHPKPAPPAPEVTGGEVKPIEPKPTDVVVAGASKGQQAMGYIAAGGLAIAGLLAL
ncbi:hypothetical protein LIA77_07625 [Sarocladium implicatum]|nr:hypothetical protein LIA77_07625 [Sarocladium implicatum]